MDTIVALATPPGRGAVATVRLSGGDAMRIACTLAGHAAPLRPRRATLATLDVSRAAAGSPPWGENPALRDRVLLTYFAGPHSYTGEDVVEIGCHGNPVIVEALVAATIRLGARPAERGEFTRRAFLNGRIDLVQAEAVGDLVDAVTARQARSAAAQVQGTLTRAIAGIDNALFDLAARLEASLDFPEEGYHFVDVPSAAGELSAIAARLDRLLADGVRGRLLREGATVAITGRPNVGKSSLFNALLRDNRAIVSATPGTTRDVISERADILGIPITLVDTAGVRESADEVEREGVARAHRAADQAALTIVVADRSQRLTEDDHRLLDSHGNRPWLVVANKTDLPAAWAAQDLPPNAREVLVAVSARTGEGLHRLEARMCRGLGDQTDENDEEVVTNARHVALLERARLAVERAIDAISESGGTISEEFLLVDVQEARAAMEEITGRRSTDDLLRRIFERFCIGK
jgi:tRNA modification GTPase